MNCRIYKENNKNCLQCLPEFYQNNKTSNDWCARSDHVNVLSSQELELAHREDLIGMHTQTDNL